MSSDNGVKRFLAVWHKAECWVAVICFTFMTCIMLTDVMLREAVAPLLKLFGRDPGAMGIFAAQKMSVYALVIGSFAGIGIATATASHLVPRVGFKWIPEAMGPAMDRFADMLTAVFLLVVSWYGFVFVLSSKATDLRAPVLDWSVWPFQLAIPLGFLSAAVRYFVFAAKPALKPIPPEFQE